MQKNRKLQIEYILPAIILPLSYGGFLQDLGFPDTNGL